MSKDFDFDDVGKRMPYKTPDSFFEDNRREILRRTCGESHHGKFRLRIIIPVILAVAAVLTGLFFMPLLNKKDASPVVMPSLVLINGSECSNSDAMDNFIENLSDEELREYAEFSENDVFLF